LALGALVLGFVACAAISLASRLIVSGFLSRAPAIGIGVSGVCLFGCWFAPLRSALRSTSRGGLSASASPTLSVLRASTLYIFYVASWRHLRLSFSLIPL
ncbi:MAG: hypothetical protein WC455_29690, partial [Dehalococcoidia bacterium]